MKKLLLSLLLALPLTAAAQTTNVFYVLTVEEGTTRTNSFTNSLASVAVTGIHAAYQSYKDASTNNTANFRGFTRQYFKDISETPLKELGRNYEMEQAKVTQIMTSILANWDTASAADRKLLTDWLAKYPVGP